MFDRWIMSGTHKIGARSNAVKADGARLADSRVSNPPGRLSDLLCVEDAVFLGATLFVVLVAGQAVRIAGFEGPALHWFALNIRLYLLISGLVILGEATLRLVRDRPASPIRYFSSAEYREIVARRIFAMPPLVAVGLLMPAFSAFKSSIGQLNSFEWDTTFIALDRALHGTDPWRLLQPLMGHPALTWLASELYHAWFMLIYLGPVLFAFFVRDRQLRFAFFTAYLASWTIVGMVFATLFASVGPCFVGPILGIDHFADQIAYLRGVDANYPLAVLEVQQQLLDWYSADDRGLGRGITAMPSMHVALAWLYVLASWRIDRRLGWAFAAFFVAIQLASIHLAYHYAVDGYLAVALVTAIWFACRKISLRFVDQKAATTGDDPRGLAQ